jgi:hypothetical protein
VSMKNVTPDEVQSGIKPFVDHFRVFGCLAYAHVPDNHIERSWTTRVSSLCI